MSDYLSPFLDDGYTRSYYFAPVPQLCSAMRFTARPMLIEERAEISQKIRQINGGERPDSKRAEREQAVEIAKRLVSWDVKNSQGETVPINTKNVLRIQSSRFSRLCDVIIFGLDGGEPDPQAGTDATLEHDDTASESALTGKPVADVVAEAAEKN